jgi:hypothetical protein
MSELIAIEFDALTGETIERELTTEEIAQHKKDVMANKKQQAQAEAKAAARASALAKLADLGLTTEEIAAL